MFLFLGVDLKKCSFPVSKPPLSLVVCTSYSDGVQLDLELPSVLNVIETTAAEDRYPCVL